MLGVFGDVPPVDVWSCRAVQVNEPVRLAVRSEGVPTDFAVTGWAAIPVVSQRLADVLISSAGSDVQLIPALVDRVSGGSWSILNIIARPDCLDHQRSRITYHLRGERAGKPRGIEKLIVDPRRTDGYRVFRPKDWEISIIVDDKVREAVERIGATGLTFLAAT